MSLTSKLCLEKACCVKIVDNFLFVKLSWQMPFWQLLLRHCPMFNANGKLSIFLNNGTKMITV